MSVFLNYLDPRVSNVYSAPTADLKTDSGHGETRVFALNGRIGRVRYYVYMLFGVFAVLLINAYLMGSMNPLPVPGNSGIFKQVVDGLLSAIVGVVVARRRLQDMDSPWGWSLLSLIPFVNFIFWLVLVFAPGTNGDNRYGPKPQPNTTGVIVLAWVLPVLLGLGILLLALMWNAISGGRWI